MPLSVASDVMEASTDALMSLLASLQHPVANGAADRALLMAVRHGARARTLLCIAQRPYAYHHL